MASTADILTALATSIATAVITAWVTVRLSVRQFQSQKWWERKVDAYSRIIEAVQAMYRFDTEAFDAAIEGRQLRPDFKERLEEGWSAGRDELQRAIGYGSLVISPSAYRALMELEDGLDTARRERMWDQHLDAEAAVLAKCLGALRQCAATDLGVARPRKFPRVRARAQPGDASTKRPF